MNLQLFITGGDFKGADRYVLPTLRGCSDPPPAVLCLQNLAPAPLNQEEKQSSDHQSKQQLSEHGAQCGRCLGQRWVGGWAGERKEATDENVCQQIFYMSTTSLRPQNIAFKQLDL